MSLRQENYGPLPTRFNWDGFTHQQLLRSADVVLLEKTKPTHSLRHYEVAVIQHCPERTWPDGHVTPPHEAMPSPESWGTYGWSFSDLDRARAKFSELVQARDVPRQSAVSATAVS